MKVKPSTALYQFVSFLNPLQLRRLRWILFLTLGCLCVPETVFGELSVASKLRVQQATRQCAATDNKLKYKKILERYGLQRNR